MRRLLAALLLLIAPATADAQRYRIRVALPGFPAPISVDSLTSNVEIKAPRGAVFAAVAATFEELKIPVDTRDSLQGIIGNTRIQQMRRFAGERMSRLLNCGNGMTGPNADDWRIYLAVFAIVEAKDNQTSLLRTGFVAGAQDFQGPSKDPVQCGTTGIFEADLVERVKKRVSASR